MPNLQGKWIEGLPMAHRWHWLTISWHELTIQGRRADDLAWVILCQGISLTNETSSVRLLCQYLLLRIYPNIEFPQKKTVSICLGLLRYAVFATFSLSAFRDSLPMSQIYKTREFAECLWLPAEGCPDTWCAFNKTRPITLWKTYEGYSFFALAELLCVLYDHTKPDKLHIQLLSALLYFPDFRRWLNIGEIVWYTYHENYIWLN